MWHLRPEVSTQADIEYIEEEVPSMLNSRLALVQYICTLRLYISSNLCRVWVPFRGTASGDFFYHVLNNYVHTVHGV